MKSLLAALIALLAFPAFAGPISGYPAATTPLTGGETAIGTQSGTTVQITTGSVATLATSPTTVTALPAATTLAGTEPLIGIQSGTTVKITAAQIAALANASAATGAWTNSISGSVARTIGGKLSETVSVLDFGALCDGTTNDTTAINAAITAVNAAGGGTVLVPTTGHACLVPTGTISMLPGVILQGQSYGTGVIPGSQILCGGTGDCIASISSINSSTNVSNGVRDLNVKCTNGSNTAGAGYDDVGGTFVTLSHLRVRGCGYGVIFDQSEISTLADSDLEAQVTASLWLVDGSQHTPGASGQFTNNITVQGTQFNSGSTTHPLIIDDGGSAHVFLRNNLNGGGVALADAATFGLSFMGNEVESNSLSALTFSNLAADGTTVGSSSGVIVQGNQITPTTGQHGIAIVSLGSMSVVGNSFGSSSASMISASATFALYLQSNFLAGGYSNELTGGATNLINLDGSAPTLNLAAITTGNKAFAVAGAATIASGFGTSPSIAFASNTAAFEIVIGSGGTATFGTLTMPAATTGWACTATDRTGTSSTNFITKETATGSTSVTFQNYNDTGTAGAWSAADVLAVQCSAF